MSVRNIHPLYAEMLHYWTKCRDAYKGQDHIKKQRTRYLPATSGMILDGQGTVGTPGENAYLAYLERAYCPETYEEAVANAVGVMHRKSAEIQLPAGLKSLMDKATLEGESLHLFLRRINAEQLISGRLGILGDIRKDDDGKPFPIILLYKEKAIRNWDDRYKNTESSDARFVILDESSHEATADLSWEIKEKFRVVALTNEQDGIIDQGEQTGIYKTKVLGTNDGILTGQWETPSLQGVELKQIPFSFINAADISSNPGLPPLKGLANIIFAIYRAEADYRQNLFMQGQDTLVRIGATDTEDAVRTGAGARIDVPMKGDAKYIGVTSNGLSEQRTSRDKDYERAEQKAGQLLNQQVGAEESAEALRVRIAARSASLPDIAKAGAKGLEKVLKALAVWFGENPDEVVVKPNLEFANPDQNGRTLTEIALARVQGAPISEYSYHEWIRDNKFSNLTYEEELIKMSEEKPRVENDADI